VAEQLPVHWNSLSGVVVAVALFSLVYEFLILQSNVMGSGQEMYCLMKGRPPVANAIVTLGV